MHRSFLRAALCALILGGSAVVVSAHEGGDHKGHDHGKSTAAAASGGKAGGAAASAKTPPAQAADAAKKDAAVTAIDQQIAMAKVDKKAAGWKTRLPMPKVVKFEAGKQYFARVETSEGVVRIKFMPEVAPMHVTNFIYLTRLGFYDGIVFHRVIPKFMAQGGCPLGNGMGQPGYGFGGEFSPKVRHDRPGLLSMANTGQPNSDGSQFFLTFVATPWLNDKHTIFGEVIEGLDVLKKMEAAGSQSGQTSKRMTMDKVTIEVI